MSYELAISNTVGVIRLDDSIRSQFVEDCRRVEQLLMRSCLIDTAMSPASTEQARSIKAAACELIDRSKVQIGAPL